MIMCNFQIDNQDFTNIIQNKILMFHSEQLCKEYINRKMIYLVTKFLLLLNENIYLFRNNSIL